MSVRRRLGQSTQPDVGKEGMRMAKLSTGQLKKFITEQMTDDLLREVAGTYGYDDEHTARCLEQAGARQGEDMLALVTRILRRTSGWARESKCRLGQMGELDDFTYPDVAGEVFDTYITDELKQSGEEKNCWFRMFIPKNELLADNYRIEIITDPDDSEILCWNMVVD